ncbi:cytochrome P450 [Mycena leptocephala]|nr:cytochrome P450 [Mycena leptocephala]
MAFALILLISLAGLGFLYIFHLRPQRQSLKPPPGPPKDPFIGHLRHMPATQAPLVFHEWAKTYGDVMQLQVLGRSIIILDTHQAAADLLDKKGSIYSDRPEFPLYNILGWTYTLGFIRYGKEFAKQRQVHQSYLSRQKCTDFKPMQTQEARRLVRNLLISSPEKFSISIIVQIVAGHSILSGDDPYLHLCNMVNEALSLTGAPGSSAIDFFPVLRCFPSWFPGTHYAGVARAWRPAVRRLYDYPLECVQRQWEAGEASPSFLLSHLENIHNNNSEIDQDELKGAAATMFSAGEATTWSAVTSFVLAMVLHPQSQIRAQNEIDSVVGMSRLPNFGDRENLPYVECVLQETLRYTPLLPPVGLPHRSIEDDVYRGMHIPKGSIVFANIRGISLDESVYKNARSFLPERFFPEPLGNGAPHFTSVFGFGRRICTGLHLADNTLWIAIVSILATCTISHALDERGNKIVPEIIMSDGLSRCFSELEFVRS